MLNEMITVEMQFTNDLISVVIDQFGDDITIRRGGDENTFFATFDVVIAYSAERVRRDR